MDIKKIENLLKQVEKPGRYTGGEFGANLKPKKDGDLTIAFCFPDAYEIGMSNLGMKILCDNFNRVPYIRCERCYAPRDDMEKLMRAESIPLFSIDSREPLSNFDIVAFTLQYELSYSNVINMLDLASIPLYSKDRNENHPLIIGGGPCAYNPEPIADFFDVFSIGEGEEALLEFAELYYNCKKDKVSRKDFLRKASHINGMYVPSLYDVTYNDDGTIKSVLPKHDDVPSKIRKTIIEDFDKVYFPTAPAVPNIEVVHDRVMLEVFRGCIRGCRFCQAGMVYRPYREKSPETLDQIARKCISNTGYSEISLSALSISDYTHIKPLIERLLEWTEDKKVNLSLPSMRLDSFYGELLEKTMNVRQSGLTFAPEAGTQRLRNVINKNINESDIVSACDSAFDSGRYSVKLYFMNGLPTETEDDILGIAETAKTVLDTYYSKPRQKGKQPSVTVSVSCFVPKPFTPFQWEPQDTREMLIEKQQLLKNNIKSRKISYKYHDADVSFLEAVFARGDRRLAPALAEACKRGQRFDSWDEFFNIEVWEEIFKDCGIDPTFYANRRIGFDEVLAWDHIDCGIRKEFLINEAKKAYAETTTPDCRTKCSACGMKCKPYDSIPEEYTPKKAVAKNEASNVLTHVRVFFKKKGSMKFISHLDLARSVTRALFRTELPIYYTEGFNPHPKIVFALPLSIFQESEYEIFDFALYTPVPFAEIEEKLKKAFPELEIFKVTKPKFKLKEVSSASYKIALTTTLTADEISEKLKAPVNVLKKTKSKTEITDISPQIEEYKVYSEGANVIIEAKVTSKASSILNPQYIVNYLGDDVTDSSITRTALYHDSGEIFE